MANGCEAGGAVTIDRRSLLFLAAASVATGCAQPGDKSAGRLGATLGSAPRSNSAPPASSSVDDVAARRPVRWGTELPGIVRHLPPREREHTLALTFDACGGRGGGRFDQDLIDFLRREGIVATLFLNERWVQRHPGLTADLVADPLFEVANHGSRHVPLSVTGRAAYGIGGTRSARDVVAEVTSNQRTLAALTGTEPQWFRSGTAHYDDVAVDLVAECGLRVAGFAVNADAGATATTAQVARALRNAGDGAIVLMHMNQPGSGTLPGLRRALPALRRRGVRFAQLTAGSRPIDAPDRDAPNRPG